MEEKKKKREKSLKSTSMKTRKALAELTAVVIAAVIFTLLLRYALITYTGLQTPLVVVKGHSMYPFFLDGDMVLIRKEDVNKIALGNIIVYRTFTGKMIIHRVIEKINVSGHPELIVKGDNNPFPDISPISNVRLVGEVIAIPLDDNGSHINIVPKIPLIGKFIPTLEKG